jgi:copper resistance protein C
VRRIIAPVIVLLTISETGLAHSLLLLSSPAAGAIVSAPLQLKLAFGEGVEPALTGASLKCAGVEMTPVGEPTLSSDNRVLELALPTLPKGVCSVRWHAVSVDGHRTKGEFSFAVH